ncbi:MAG: prolyl oligopeptidase family serine peptidase [Planctomycetales bacterium]
MLRTVSTALVLVLGGISLAWGDGPADNNPLTVRRIPSVGIEVPEAVHKEFTEQLSVLGEAISTLAKSSDRRILELLPDVQIFHKGVQDALKHREFFNEKELPVARKLLAQGLERAAQLQRGEAPWESQTGLVVRGYVSRIDGSVQPYGLVVPDSYVATGAQRHRLDIWFHGRGEVLSEVNFLDGRQRDRGIFTPRDALVLHPYGRYCNAFKFAGEVDVLEALESVQKRYRIDEDRIAVRGFSMGGAACWQFAVHYADRWVGATPGAGFSETPRFLEFFQKETLNPTPWEKTLWRWYDCNAYALNLYHLPTIAYSGDQDIQKQAADVMEEALRQHGIDLVHLIGPKTGHSYHPAVRDEIDRRLTSIVAKGRDRAPREVHFTTYTLKYNRMHWVAVEGLGEHWEPARVDALLSDSGVALTTQNVTELTLSFPAGWAPFEVTEPVALSIDDQVLTGPRPRSDRSWDCPLHRVGNEWRVGGRAEESIRKRHDLQGPIDDAFMDSFLFVRPTGKASHPAVERWFQAELEHALVHWRQHFRGDARVKDDQQITPEDIASAHLVLWGDPASNSVLKKIAGQLPVQWTDREVVAGDRRFPAVDHAPVLIHPNPLNPERYVVLNSSFTYREYDYLNNARQVPRLPDWAIIDLKTPPGSQYPGKIVAADFFDEQWKLKRPTK